MDAQGPFIRQSALLVNARVLLFRLVRGLPERRVSVYWWHYAQRENALDVRVRRKSPESLIDTKLIQQTGYWSRVKSALGWKPAAFDIEFDSEPAGDLLILGRDIGAGASWAYAPYGPERLPDEERRGEYLTALSREIRPHLDASCIGVRWDLPWESPYASEDDRFDEDGNWMGPPETRVRELRMNWGVGEVGLRKAPTDLLPTDTMVVDLRPTERDILAGMRGKTRYNIGLSEKREVRVRVGGHDDLAVWNGLHAATARRNGIIEHGPEHFEPLLAAGRHSVRMLIAERGGIPLAAMFLSFSGGRASYLYGASSDDQRDCMAPYALQWAAIKEAKAARCSSYDLFGVSPGPVPEHPMFGLYQFKRGFGGTLLHRQGAWDYPFAEDAYAQYRAAETTAKGFNV